MRWRAVAAVLGAGLLVLASASHGYVGGHVFTGLYVLRLKLAELVLATLVLFVLGWPALVHSVRAARAGRADGAALAIGAALLAYLYGVLAIAAPGWFPPGMRRVDLGVAPHFEASALAAAAGLWLSRRRDG